MTRSASFLAALASAALPGLDPVSVRSVRRRAGDPYDVAFVEDSKARHWVVQAPRTPVAGAMLEDVTELSALLGRRLDLAVPVVEGQVVVPEGRAVVYAALPGRPLHFSALPPGLGLAADLGRALAHIHNLEVELFDEAGRPTYDADTTRTRLLTDLDRAAETGQVPTPLLARWEHALEDVSLWHFLPAPVHGSFTGAAVLASFEAEDDADSGRVSAILDWGQAHVGDPAEDFADLVASASPEALRSVLAAYAPSRVDVPDPALIRRAGILSELRSARLLLTATAAQDEQLEGQALRALSALEGRVSAEGQSPAASRPSRRALLSETEGPSQAPEDAATPARPSRSAPGVVTVGLPLASAAGEPALIAESNAPEPVAAGGKAPPEHSEPERDDVAREDPRGADPEAEGAYGHDSGGEGSDGDQPDGDQPDGDQPDGDGVLDLHEGASEFVPVEQPVERDRRGP